ncbi:hypothetical protein M422DRAFT_247324 [Sphaerobolus stellatus SS14]|nr:hypothetical protein M422DRAFT_247324 [Sphaerobolus stellatus SS14]
MVDTWPISSEIRPLNAQLPSLRESASKKGRALEDCRIQIVAIEDQLKTLRIHEAELDRVYEDARTLLAPIRRPPDDVLHAILEAYSLIKRQTDQGIHPLSVLTIWTDQSQLHLIADQVQLLSIECHQGIEVLESFNEINPLWMPTLRILSSVFGLGLLCWGQSAMTNTSMLALKAPNLLSLDLPKEFQFCLVHQRMPGQSSKTTGGFQGSRPPPKT